MTRARRTLKFGNPALLNQTRANKQASVLERQAKSEKDKTVADWLNTQASYLRSARMRRQLAPGYTAKLYQ